MPQLDGLRAFAVASVAVAHWVPKEYHYGLPWGTSGVQLFFVLSGFLITGILLRCRDSADWGYAARAFYARRFLRIFPLFYAVLLAAYVLNVRPVRESIAWHVTYMSNFYMVSHGGWHGSISHFWSLAVEEQFYLFWPTVILCIPQRHLMKALAGLIGVGILSRFLLPILFPQVPLLSVLPNSNFDALGLGAMLAYVGTRRTPRWFEWICVAGLPLFIALLSGRVAGVLVPLHTPIQHLAMLLSFTWLVKSAANGFGGVVGKALQASMLVYLGRISYGFYVLHNFAPTAVRIGADALGVPEYKYGLTGFALMAFVTIAAASLSWHMFEAPINSLKRYFPYARPETQPAVVHLKPAD